MSLDAGSWEDVEASFTTLLYVGAPRGGLVTAFRVDVIPRALPVP